MLMVTGICTDLEVQKNYLSQAKLSLGIETRLIPNGTSGAVLDIGFAIAGILSSAWGFKVEIEATRELYRQILKELRKDGEIKLFAYSQGSIITCNTLVKIKERLVGHGEEATWKKLAERISITTVGAAMHLWPKEIKQINSFSLEGDIVTKITLPLLKIYQKLAGDDYRFVNPQVEKFDGPKEQAHSFTNYLKILKERLQ